MRKLLASLALLLPFVLEPSFAPSRPVLPPDKLGELVVLTRNSPTTRYVDQEGRYSGVESDLIQMFARETGLRVRYLDRQPLHQILPALQRQQAHLAAAGLAITSDRLDHFQFSPAYQMVQGVIAYNSDNRKPRGPKDLAGKRIEVVKGAAEIEDLRLLKSRFPRIRWHEVPESDSEGLLIRLSQGQTDYVVAEAHVLDIVRKFYPNVSRAFPLGDPKPLAWMFPKNADPRLVDQAEEFFLRLIYDGTMRQLLERYYGHAERLNPLDVANFLEQRVRLLPTYAPMFKEAQELTGIDWRLLAALGFQESHWNPLATSPTGVRGLMMLTIDTVDRMGVSDRLDARQNILAGAKYLLELKDTLPLRIREPDRTWLALAAYNIGYGHLEDGRVLAQRRKLDPDLWSDVKSVLPLLSQYEHYSTVRYGFCRGGEAVILTENVRAYHEILLRLEAPHTPGFELFAAPVISGRAPR